MAEPENLMLPILREIRAEMREMRSEMATKGELGAVQFALKSDIADLRSEMNSGFADVASDMMDVEKRLGDRIATLNRAVMEYRSFTIGHGVLYS